MWYSMAGRAASEALLFGLTGSSCQISYLDLKPITFYVLPGMCDMVWHTERASNTHFQMCLVCWSGCIDQVVLIWSVAAGLRWSLAVQLIGTQLLLVSLAIKECASSVPLVSAGGNCIQKSRWSLDFYTGQKPAWMCSKHFEAIGNVVIDYFLWASDVLLDWVNTPGCCRLEAWLIVTL